MSRYDSVDRLMGMATEKAVPARGTRVADMEPEYARVVAAEPLVTPLPGDAERRMKPDAEEVLAKQMMRSERGLGVGTADGTLAGLAAHEEHESEAEQTLLEAAGEVPGNLSGNAAGSAAGNAAGSAAGNAAGNAAGEPAGEPGALRGKAGAPGRAGMSAAERGRQFFGAIRPFLPVVGSALRMVDHGAVQAVARLLPLLGGAGSALGAGMEAGQAAPAGGVAKAQEQLTQIFSGIEKQQAETAEELKKYKQRTDHLEEVMRRTRDSLERTVAEQNALNHLLRQMRDRSRLLTAGVVILLMLVVAEMALLVFVLHK